MTLDLYPDSAGEWRWRLSARNGNILADSGEGYKSRAKAKNMALKLFSGAKYHEVRESLHKQGLL